MFAPYDAFPEYIDTHDHGGYLKNKKESPQFINSAEQSLFGKFNVGQIEDFPSIKIKKAAWVEFICFNAEIDKIQMY